MCFLGLNAVSDLRQKARFDGHGGEGWRIRKTRKLNVSGIMNAT